MVLRGTNEKNVKEALGDFEKKMHSFLETVLKAISMVSPLLNRVQRKI